MAAGQDAKRHRGPRLIAIGMTAGPHEVPVAARKTAIGSAPDNQIVIADQSVSRHHALIRRRLRGYDLIDLESTNGSFVNAKRVTNPVTLKRGDELRFGQVRFAFLGAARTAGARDPADDPAVRRRVFSYPAMAVARRSRHHRRFRVARGHARADHGASRAFADGGLDRGRGGRGGNLAGRFLRGVDPNSGGSDARMA